MTKVIAIANQKGGVGKTTLTHNLAKQMNPLDCCSQGDFIFSK